MGQFVELRSGQIHIKMERSVAVHADERQIDVGRGCRRKLLLRLLSRFLQSLQRHLVARQIHAV